MMSNTAMNPVRSYCHPMDAAIIRVLDNPVTNILIKKLVSASADITFGQMLSSGVPVSEKSFPEVNEMVEHCARVLRIKKPYVIVTSSIDMNAFTLGSDKEPSIVLGSMLVKSMSPECLKFVIGHECGHIAMGHVTYTIAANILANFAASIPVVGDVVNMTAGAALNAWSRRSEVSADRAGLLCCGSAKTAKEALMQIELGLVDIGDTDVDEYVENSSSFRKANMLRCLGEFTQKHPLLPKRIEALDLFMGSSLLHRIAGAQPPEGAIDDRLLNVRIEKLIRVI